MFQTGNTLGVPPSESLRQSNLGSSFEPDAAPGVSRTDLACYGMNTRSMLESGHPPIAAPSAVYSSILGWRHLGSGLVCQSTPTNSLGLYPP